MKQKGQGIIEYALLLMLIVSLAAILASNYNLQNSISNVMSAVERALGINETESYDTGITAKFEDNGPAYHYTSLSIAGSNTPVVWYLNSSGQRVYVLKTDNFLHDTTDLQGISSNRTDRPYQTDSNGGVITYFKANDGFYYKITAYDDKATTLTRYDGTPNSAYVRQGKND